MPLYDLPQRLWQRLVRERHHAKKRWWQREHLPQTKPKTILFSVGCQRSGTNMLANVLDESPHIWVYHESDGRAFHRYRLRPRPVIERLVSTHTAPVIVFKPICDLHWSDLLLKDYPNAKLLWIYRRYQDVANSAVKMWGDHQREIIRWIYERDWEQLGWRGERLGTDQVSLVTRLYRPTMSPHEGAALFWYLRNQSFFRLDLYNDARALLLRYEDLVQQPDRFFPRIFDFLESPYQPEFVAQVTPTSIGKSKFPPINPEIERLCEALLQTFEEQYNASLA